MALRVRPHEVYGLDTYELVRRSVLVSGMSERAAAREFGLNRRTVAKMVDEPVPAGYQLSKARKKPKLGPFLSRIEEILLGDESAPCKQRHQSKPFGLPPPVKTF